MDFSITLKDALSKYKTFLVTKEGCPFCIRACGLLKSHNIEYKEFDFEKYKVLNDEVTKAKKHTTYPKIFLNGEWIGGCSELTEHLKK